MTKLTPSFTACAALLLLSVGVTPLANAPHIFIDPGTLGGSDSVASTSNNAAQVAENAVASDGEVHTTVRNGGSSANLGTLDVSDNIAYAINDDGQGAGNASAINNNDEAAGNAGSTHGSGQGTARSGGSITNPGTRGGSGSVAGASNNIGQGVGNARNTDGGGHDIFRNGGTIIDLGTLDVSDSNASAMNNAGKATGMSHTTGKTADHDTGRNGGTGVDLNSLPVADAIRELIRANDVNKNEGIEGNHQTHSLPLSYTTASVAAIPEPGTHTLLLAGLGLLVFTTRRRKQNLR